ESCLRCLTWQLSTRSPKPPRRYMGSRAGALGIRCARSQRQEPIIFRPQVLRIILFSQPRFCRMMVYASFAAHIRLRHVLFANRISAVTIFMYAVTVTASSAAAVLTTTVLTVTGLTPIRTRNLVMVG